jgi:DNA-binding IclR family transcriptional regulator
MAAMARRSQRVRSAIPSVVDAAAGAATPVKSAGRVLEILEYFDDVKHRARASDITEHFGYPQSSTSYLLKSLTQMGYLEFNPSSRTYMPTTRVALLGSWIWESAISDGTLIRLMKTIGASTGQTVLLGARNGIYAQYIHVIEAENGFPIHVPTGTCRLLVWSAAGFALLSNEREQTIRLLVLRTNAEVPNLQIKLRQVLANVGTVRRQGYFLSDGLVTPGGAHISMPLPVEATRGRALVIGVSGRSDVIRRDEARIVEAMQIAIARYCNLESARIEPPRDKTPMERRNGR